MRPAPRREAPAAALASGSSPPGCAAAASCWKTDCAPLSVRLRPGASSKSAAFATGGGGFGMAACRFGRGSRPDIVQPSARSRADGLSRATLSPARRLHLFWERELCNPNDRLFVHSFRPFVQNDGPNTRTAGSPFVANLGAGAFGPFPLQSSISSSAPHTPTFYPVHPACRNVSVFFFVARGTATGLGDNGV